MRRYAERPPPGVGSAREPPASGGAAARTRSPGSAVNAAIREIHRGRVWRVVPVRLVAETPDELAFWHPAEIEIKRPFAGGRQLRIPGDVDWKLEDTPATAECVVLVRPGARHSLWLFFQDGEFDHWYVNFERESVWRSPFLDVVDEKLDLIATSDGTVRLKDEDELAEAARVGHLDEAEVRAELERVLADPPWPTGWETWRPDESWPLPELPPGWDAP
jgi:uncharacterized protein DUF402